MKNIFITGGAGYVGSSLVPRLLRLGYNVTVYDLLIYGENVLEPHQNLKIVVMHNSIVRLRPNSRFRCVSKMVRSNLSKDNLAKF